MHWPFARRTTTLRTPPEPPPGDGDPPGAACLPDPLAGDDALEVFVCPSCGRTNLPPAGDWDPPVCLECDAALNFDAEELGALEL